MFEALMNIPAEMRSYPQWVVWRYEDRDGVKPTKVPYDAKTGRLASVADATTWADFDTVGHALQSGNWAGAGFVFSEHDPFAGIDLDDTEGDGAALVVQQKVYAAFTSYAEQSPSGRGLHIIVKGHVPNGRRRGKIELYSSGRFFTMTGHVYRNADVNEHQGLLQQLWAELGGHIEQHNVSGDIVEKLTDDEVIAKASGAVNGDKFLSLHNGDISGYPSQSEADQAYMNFLAFYSQHRNQLMRLFRNSPLGKREKAQRNGYLNFTINRAFDKMLPPIDAEGIFNTAEEVIAQAKAEAAAEIPRPQIDLAAQIARAIGNAQSLQQPTQAQLVARPAQEPQPHNQGPTASKPLSRPPGLLGDIADYIYHAAPRPVAEIALAGAIGLMAGICGRAFNVSGTGLNQYVLLLAPTGTGKEAIKSGTEKLMRAVIHGNDPSPVSPEVFPAAKEFMGPGEYASGQAMLRTLSTKNSYVSVLGEFGATMNRLSDPRAPSSDKMLNKVLRDVYHKSGNGQALGESAYSDSDKNIKTVLAPAVSLIAESNPEEFYTQVDEAQITNGLLTRFLTIDYHGPRPKMNKNHVTYQPSDALVSQLSQIAEAAHRLNQQNAVINVGFTAKAEAMIDEIDRYSDDQQNAHGEIIKRLWNRVHLKTMKLAALIAVGKADLRLGFVTADEEDVRYAYEMVERDVLRTVRKFDMGEVGKNSEESKQVSDVLRIVKMYLASPYEEVCKYGAKRAMHGDHIIPYTFLQRRLVGAASFRHDRIGATNAIRRTIQSLLDEGVLIEVGRNDLAKYNVRGKAYGIGDATRFS